MAIVQDKITLPVDTGNAGKNKRTRTRTIGANLVHEDYVVLSSDRDYVVSERWDSGILTLPTAVQNGTTSGLIWIFNPIASANLIGVLRSTIQDQFTALAVDLVAGAVSANLFTFTGTPSGATITPAKSDSTSGTPQLDIRTAMTGMTITLGARLFSKITQTMDLITGGGGHWNPDRQDYSPESDDTQIILRPGQGVVFWSSVALTTANRRCVINGVCEEWTIPT